MSTRKFKCDRDFLQDDAIPDNQVPDDSLTPELLDLVELLVKIAVDQQDPGNTNES